MAVARTRTIIERAGIECLVIIIAGGLIARAVVCMYVLGQQQIVGNIL